MFVQLKDVRVPLVICFRRTSKIGVQAQSPLNFWIFLIYLFCFISTFVFSPQSWSGPSTPCSLSSARSSRSSRWRPWKCEARRLWCLRNSLLLQTRSDSCKASRSTTNPWWVSQHSLTNTRGLLQCFSGVREMLCVWRLEYVPRWGICGNLRNLYLNLSSAFTTFSLKKM